MSTTTVVIVVRVTCGVREIVVLRVAGGVERRLRAHGVSPIVQVIIVIVGVRVVVRGVVGVLGMHRRTAVQRVRYAIIVCIVIVIVKYLFFPGITARSTVHAIRNIVTIVRIVRVNVAIGEGTFGPIAGATVASCGKKTSTYNKKHKCQKKLQKEGCIQNLTMH